MEALCKGKALKSETSTERCPHFAAEWICRRPLTAVIWSQLGNLRLQAQVRRRKMTENYNARLFSLVVLRSKLLSLLWEKSYMDTQNNYTLLFLRAYDILYNMDIFPSGFQPAKPFYLTSHPLYLMTGKRSFFFAITSLKKSFWFPTQR